MVKAYIYVCIYIYPLRFNGNVATWTQFPLITTGIWPSPPHEPLQHGFNVLQAGAHHISEYRIRKYEPIQLNQKKKGLQIKEFQIHSPHQDQTLVRHEDRPPLREAAGAGGTEGDQTGHWLLAVWLVL